MAMQKINEEEFFRKLFEADTHTNNSKEKILERVHIIYHQKDDLQNFRGTAWGMYNAVADFCSNTTPLRATKKAGENRVVNFLDGYKLLETSQNLLMVA